MRERELKREKRYAEVSKTLSLPMRERELKQLAYSGGVGEVHVAPHAGA